MCLPGTKPEKENVTLSLRTLRTLSGLVATARLAEWTGSDAVVCVPSGLSAVATRVVVLDAGATVGNSGACAAIDTLPLASATALPKVVPPVSCTVVPATNPLPVMTIAAPWAGSALT